LLESVICNLFWLWTSLFPWPPMLRTRGIPCPLNFVGCEIATWSQFLKIYFCGKCLNFSLLITQILHNKSIFTTAYIVVSPK
jgi:hypothetical protein